MYLGPYAILAILVGIVVGGLLFAALGVIGWNLRRALRQGRRCGHCGKWGTDLDTLLHECFDHQRK